ncbi:site-specific integrase [Gramella sp. KN1008]|uniref:site-specific integrase n=1 Tax=Gramella sp. KN1008 TaxID=2529298 RepID=UPI0013F17424|nr:site-specific integrase [Gramella sp. KN1008]
MITTKIVIRKKKLQDGTYPVMLRVTKNRKSKLLPLGLRARKEDFDGQEFKKSYPGFRKRNSYLAQVKLQANKIIDEFMESEKDYSLTDFADKFLGKDHTNIIVWNFFEQKIDILDRSERLGSARAYEETMLALKKFYPKELKFKEITVDFLEKFELSMRERGNQDGGIAFKMRQLRALFNDAVRKEVVSLDHYPFKHYKISRLKGRSHKRALTVEELKAFSKVDLSEHPHLVDAHHFFMFSFYCRGMNLADMTFLRWSDIHNKKIHYSRRKTKKHFTLEILPPVEKILKFYREQKSTSPYVFPILLKEKMTAKQIANRKHKVLSRYNSRLNEIAELAGINKRITSYVARHSYATIMKYKGVSTDIISESLGHSNLGITMTYLKEFDNTIIDKEHKKLLEL